VLNPDTSSDSLSVKSNGVRLVSASTVIIHTAIIGTKISFLTMKPSFNFSLFNLFEIMTIVRINTAIEISYEMAWAVARYLPKIVNLLFEDQPAVIENIIVVDIIATKKSIERFIFVNELGFGIDTHISV